MLFTCVGYLHLHIISKSYATQISCLIKQVEHHVLPALQLFLRVYAYIMIMEIGILKRVSMKF